MNLKVKQPVYVVLKFSALSFYESGALCYSFLISGGTFGKNPTMYFALETVCVTSRWIKTVIIHTGISCFIC